ncbi:MULTISPECIES: type II TA system antitoxin MqsA family protein [Xanthomonas]|uniref:type II TA system antitoxin MqsA family protein n=1 Tax=Xanthomonas TaxID=338 RepID=UPI000A5B1F92|nr:MULTISPECIES: type II TA system antitoxin MqsA family protein [Xanthomonas]
MTTTNATELAELFATFNVPQVEAGECPVCGTEGALLAFQGEAFPLEAPGGYTRVVEGLNGVRCQECGEVFMDARSSERFAEAGEALVTYARREEAKKLKAARISLGLTQEAASVLTGGGHNAFQRYEAGLAVPVPAVNHLMGLLAKHPELGREIPGVVVVEVPAQAKRGVRTGRFQLKIDKPKTPKPGSLASVGVGHLVAAQATKAPMKRAVRAVTKKTPR